MFGFEEEDLVPVRVDVMEHYNSLVCGNLKNSFMQDKKFIKVCSNQQLGGWEWRSVAVHIPQDNI